MKSTSENFKTSVEYDINQNADKLDFLIDYKIVSLELNTPNLKQFILRKDNKKYILEVTNKSNDKRPGHNQWETDKYTYSIKNL